MSAFAPAAGAASTPSPATVTDHVPAPPTRLLDVLVIGGGQAGIAAARALAVAGLDYEVVERRSRIGDSWRNRPDSLTLFTPRRYSALDGLAVPGDPDGYPAKDEIAAYLERYVAQFDLHVQLGTNVTRMTRDGDRFLAETSRGETISARRVIVATGAYQLARVPAIASGFAPSVAQVPASAYRNPNGVAPGRVLVVGDGATGRAIALELAPTRPVTLATGRPRRLSSDRILGRSVFWWLDRLGLLRASGDSFIGRRLRAADSFPARGRDTASLRRAGVEIVGRLLSASGTTVAFAGGTSTTVATVIWASGYRDDSGWLEIAGATDASGSFRHDRGVSPVPGLFHVGRSWQTSQGSAILAGVSRDAKAIVAAISRDLASGRG